MFLQYLASGHFAVEIIGNPLSVGVALDRKTLRPLTNPTYAKWYTAQYIPMLFEPGYPQTSIYSFVYVVRGNSGDFNGAFKIGHTRRSPASRASQVSSSWRCLGTPVLFIAVPNWCSPTLEETLHFHYGARWMGNEWFRIGDSDIADMLTLPRAFLAQDYDKYAGLYPIKRNAA